MHQVVAKIAAAAREITRLQKGKVAHTLVVQGITVKVDRPKGHVQKGVDDAGNAWERTYKTDYGYIPGTEGGDGEGMDVYVGPDASSPLAHYVEQRKADGQFDEFKILLGFADRASARAMWEAHTPKRFFGGMGTVDTRMMKALLGLDPQPIFKSAAAREQAFAILLKAAQVDDEPLVIQAQRWATDRGLLESSASAELGTAVLRAAEALVAKGAADADGVGRAMFRFLCDSWDYARFASEDADLGATTAPIAKAFTAIGGAAARTEESAPAQLEKRHVRIVKAEAPTEDRTTFGIVMEPDVTDSQGHTQDAAAIWEAMCRFNVDFRNVGLQHQRLVNDRVKILESYVARVDMSLHGVDVKAGTWLMTMRYDDEAIWAKVKSGEITGYSIGGTGMEEPA
jgi:hypothetical protein